MTASHPPRRRLHIGEIDIDILTVEQALSAIEDLVEAKEGGTVYTPNIDHIVLAEEDSRLRDAYASVSLSLVDGTPVLWASRLLGQTLPEKISGSDLILPLMQRAARRGYRVYLLGAGEGVPARAAEALTRQVSGLEVVGMDSPHIDVDDPNARYDDVVSRINAARPDLVLCAFGCPKQEIFMHRVRDAIKPAVSLGIGAGLDFWAGTAVRAPAWISEAGLEWLYRLVREPRRLYRRYLLRDPKFVSVLLRDLRAARAKRGSTPEVRS